MSTEASFNLGNLVAPKGSRKTRVRVGRGTGSGFGKTAGRGGKGQTARSGKGRPKGFEGGQTPLQRRIPKFGFNRAFRRVFAVVNIAALETHFSSGDTVDFEKLVEKGLVRVSDHFFKILGEGTLSKKLTVKAHRFSKSAVQKINQAGGHTEELKIAGEHNEESAGGSR
ncbi:MAG: 50S ribosomal protein L15 [Deltaproteobacteria bacterium]|nr:50S ribosomal protein L15 [Deltaproteobacteria bacterium]MBI3293541.1 50S ribosomal protein L15 [Deltaproteobacteria bacterium]